MNFKKIAICLPSYNESNNISNITLIVDEALKKYSNYDTYIVNADSASTDSTNEIFNNTLTSSKKVSLISDKKGKGINLLNFFKFCEKENIDYAMCVDSDLLSITTKWISKMLDEMIIRKADYVIPIYKRSRYEGSTTNHFAFPLVYATTGFFIRQPIAGDFGFNKKFIKVINKQKYTNSTMQYGIDIFMTLTACNNNLNVHQILLDKKIHSPSFNKMENMFIEVLDSALHFLKNNKIVYHDLNCDFDLCSNILKSRTFKHKNSALEIKKKYLINNIDVEQEWINIMINIVNNPNCYNSDDYDYIRKIFINRAVDFWMKSQYISSNSCENEILNQCYKINSKGKMKNEY